MVLVISSICRISTFLHSNGCIFVVVCWDTAKYAPHFEVDKNINYVKTKEEIKAKAQAEVDAKKAEAEAKKKEAEDKAKAEAEAKKAEAKKKAEEEAKKKAGGQLKGMFGK